MRPKNALIAALAVAGLGVGLGTGLAVAPAEASDQDIALLKSYVGDWRGTGTMVSNDDKETVRCALKVTDSATTKVTINSRCAFAGGRLSLNGTMAYIAEKNRFEAVVTSNTSYKGQAIGQRRGDAVSFALVDPDSDAGGPLDIVVTMALKNDKIDVDFKATNSGNGAVTTAEIPFSK